MYHGNAIGVVVPAYNEERFVGTVIDTVPEFVDRVYVIDDHSADGTWREITSHASRVNARTTTTTGKRDVTQLTADGGERFDDPRASSEVDSDGGEQFDDPQISWELDSDGDESEERRIVAIRHPTNRGRGAAVKTGYKRALEDGMDIVVVMDGDGQMDPDILTSIVDPVADGTADYAVGDRLAGPSYWRGMPPWRLFGNTLLSGLTRIASGYWHIRDPQNGYTAISADALEDLEFSRLYDQYGFLNDLLVNLNVADKRVATVPMYARYGDEESGIRYSSFVPGLSVLLLKDFLWRLLVTYVAKGDYAPVGVYVLGAVSLLAGFGRFGRGLVGKTDSSGSGVRVVGGVLALAVAMFLDDRANDHLQKSVDARDVLAQLRESADSTSAAETEPRRDDHPTDRIL